MVSKCVDDIDRELLALLQEDATQAYAALGKAVGLSAGAAHERVRKLRERGVIRRTTVEVDPAARRAGRPGLRHGRLVGVDGRVGRARSPRSPRSAGILARQGR